MQIGRIHVIEETIKIKEVTIIAIAIIIRKTPFFVIPMMQLELFGRKESI